MVYSEFDRLTRNGPWQPNAECKVYIYRIRPFVIGNTFFEQRGYMWPYFVRGETIFLKSALNCVCWAMGLCANGWVAMGIFVYRLTMEAGYKVDYFFNSY